MQRQKTDKKIILGITGSFGSGKSTVSGIFKTFGAQIIDADKLAHACIEPEGRCYKRIIKAFGALILRSDKTINRAGLGEIVFRNKKSLEKINSIIHPEVIRQIKAGIRASKSRVVVLDVPLLIESGLSKLVDKLIVVKISREAQIKRAKRRGHLSKADISKRINSQIPLRLKERLADFVIDNSGTIGETKKQVGEIRRFLWKN